MKFIFLLFVSFLTYDIKLALTGKTYTNQIKQTLTNRKQKHKKKKVPQKPNACPSVENTLEEKYPRNDGK